MATGTNGIATEQNIYDKSKGLFFASSTNKCPTKSQIMAEDTKTAAGLISISDSYLDEQCVKYSHISINKRIVNIHVYNNAAETKLGIRIFTDSNYGMCYKEFDMPRGVGSQTHITGSFELDINDSKNNLNDQIKIKMTNFEGSDKNIYCSATTGYDGGKVNVPANDAKITTTTIYVKDLLKSIRTFIFTINP